jgi:methylamine dehydrogenase heavy chain
MRFLAVAVAGVMAQGASLNVRSEDLSRISIPEAHSVAVLPPAGPDRLYVLDMVFSHPIAGKAFVVEGREQKVVGSITAGYMPSIVIAPDHKQIFVLGSFWSRGARGERTDVVTYYDASTLAPTAEVVLPPGRFLIADKAHNADLTSDGKYLLVTNMAPATSVTVIDVAQQSVIGRVETPGCTFVYPSGPNRFASLCADGSMFTASFDAAGKATSQRSKPFFDVKNDPVFEHAGLDRQGGIAHFLSYRGQVLSVDLSSSAAVLREPWPILSEKDARKGWRPGGWQLLAFHRASSRLLVLMHRGGDWTHKQAGSEIWVMDVATRRRVGRIKLKEPAGSIAVSQAPQDARLYAMGGHRLYTYDLDTGKYLGKLEEMGDTPLELVLSNR